MANASNTADVSTVKGVSGGYAFSAPQGTTLPTSYSAELDAAFVNLGFVSDSGLEEEISTDTTEHTDMNGDTVCVSKDKETETIKLTLISITKDALSESFGHGAVDDADGQITIRHTNVNRLPRSYVFLLLLKDGRPWTKVVPNGTVTEVGAVTMVSGDLYGREITINCMPDADGNRIYDYIKSNATEAPSGE